AADRLGGGECLFRALRVPAESALRAGAERWNAAAESARLCGATRAAHRSGLRGAAAGTVCADCARMGGRCRIAAVFHCAPAGATAVPLRHRLAGPTARAAATGRELVDVAGRTGVLRSAAMVCALHASGPVAVAADRHRVRLVLARVAAVDTASQDG